MKKILFNIATVVVLVALFFTSCTDPLETARKNAPIPEIRALTLTNGGLAGTQRITGVVDNENFVITFSDVPAETDFSAIKFEYNLSIGAELDKPVYDFLTGQENQTQTVEQIVIVKNPDILKEREYNVILQLKAAEVAPIIDNIVVQNDKGEQHTVTMTNVFDNMLLLGMVDSKTCDIVSVSLKPARATYEFSDIVDKKLHQDNPGTLTLDFMGLKTVYELSWASSPVPGADFEKAVVHDFTVNTSIFPEWADENTRGGDIDENYILVVNRASATESNPFLLKVDDVLQDNATNKIPLNIDGIEGGTFYISAGRLTQGHVFCCNLPALGVTADAAEAGDGPLKVYHWATPSSKPEVVLSWDGTGFTNSEDEYHARLGDNISLQLDQAGNGYAFFSQQEGAGLVVRFTVRNFTEWSEPFKIQLPAVANYYGMYNKVTDNEYVFKAVFLSTMWLLDADGNKLASLTLDGVGYYSTDVRIITFNRARYLISSCGRRFAYYPPEGVNVYDLTEGMTTAEAIKNFIAAKPVDPESEDPTDPDFLPYVPLYRYVYDSETISQACVAICNAVERNGKLLILTAAPHAGMALIEVPQAM